MIAGLSALLLQENPNLSPNEIKTRLKDMSLPIVFNRNKEGWGRPKLS
jgi:hypothetical protein